MHVVVTGASSGIGEAIAREYLARGANVTLVARRRERLEAIAKSAGDGAGGRANVMSIDLADPEHSFAWLDDAETALGPIDVLVNNAGVQIVKPTVDTDFHEGQKVLWLDLHVPMRLTMLVLRRMIPRRTGTIVDVASMAAIAPTPGMFFYNAAKAGLGAASEGLRAEVKPYGIHVVTVYPGPVTSAMETAARASYEDTFGLRHTPQGSPEVLARLVCDAVESKKHRVIYPRFYALARLLPSVTRWVTDALTPRLRS